MSPRDWYALAWLLDYMLWIGAFALLAAGAVELGRWLRSWWKRRRAQG